MNLDKPLNCALVSARVGYSRDKIIDMVMEDFDLDREAAVEITDQAFSTASRETVVEREENALDERARQAELDLRKTTWT